MPHTRGKNPKSKKLSLQSVLRSKDKTDKSSNMDSNNPGFNINDIVTWIMSVISFECLSSFITQVINYLDKTFT